MIRVNFKFGRTRSFYFAFLDSQPCLTWYIVCQAVLLHNIISLCLETFRPFGIPKMSIFLLLDLAFLDPFLHISCLPSRQFQSHVCWHFRSSCLNLLIRAYRFSFGLTVFHLGLPFFIWDYHFSFGITVT